MNRRLREGGREVGEPEAIRGGGGSGQERALESNIYIYNVQIVHVYVGLQLNRGHWSVYNYANFTQSHDRCAIGREYMCLCTCACILFKKS